MPVDVKQTALAQYLEQKNSQFYGKIQELREVIQGWLSYVPATFPHYTSHTVEHSEEIILQLSKLLFKDGEPSQPSVPFSSVEVYILIASAYLHDAGMVTSEKEKSEIISSDSWRQWTTDNGGGAKRWNGIRALREGNEPADGDLRNFLADVQSRYLIAEFIRRSHHLRSARVIELHQGKLGRFAFDDPQLQQAITNVCVGHGLHPRELLDVHNYPERRDIRGEAVNLRFLALLLRIGDLLDMSCDRACPLLLSAASPLPAESLAHWSQYRCITHRMTAQDRIEVTAYCETQEEHRVLHDWCEWLEEEVKNAALVMGNARRHHTWQAPFISMERPNHSIEISPAEGATYVPSNWTLDFDRDAILERLIYDVHRDSRRCILELIQNALDATRTKMFADLVEEGIQPPEYPTQVDDEYRSKYPISIALREEDVPNELSGEYQRSQVLTIEDFGTGMNRHIIEKFFLQIGRSFYTTDEYRRACKFHPISRFGIGFLSVFAVSDKVVVETFRPQDAMSSESLRITLTGPSNYLLTERGVRNQSGTHIEVYLRESIQKGELSKLVQEWCPKVEFPLIIDDLGSNSELKSEEPSDIIFELPDVTEEGAKFVVRAFEINDPPVEGCLYVLAHVGKDGERWDRRHWASYSYPSMHPQACKPPELVESLCVHGLKRFNTYSLDFSRNNMVARLDYRGLTLKENLARDGHYTEVLQAELDASSREVIDSAWKELLSKHLKEVSVVNTTEGWKYKQRLVDEFPISTFWRQEPGSIRLYSEGNPHCVSLETLLAEKSLRVLMSKAHRRRPSNKNVPDKYDSELLASEGALTLTEHDLNCLSYNHRASIFANRFISDLERTQDGDLAIVWSSGDREALTYSSDHYEHPVEIAELPESEIVGYPLHMTTDTHYPHSLLNSRNPFVQWLIGLNEIEQVDVEEMNEQSVGVVWDLLHRPLHYTGLDIHKLNTYLDRWRNIPELSSELYPPQIKLVHSMFEHPAPGGEHISHM